MMVTTTVHISCALVYGAAGPMSDDDCKPLFGAFGRFRRLGQPQMAANGCKWAPTHAVGPRRQELDVANSTRCASVPTRRFASGLIGAVTNTGDQHDDWRRTSWNDSPHCDHRLLPAQNLNSIS